jgi:enoyl-CoA hydratase/carnithine racemase
MATIRTEMRGDGVLLATLDRPPANAIDETLLGDLDGTLAAAETDAQVRALVLTGAGAFFSGGFDLAAPRRDGSAAREMRALYRDVHVRLLALPKPTVAMLCGHAIAGGLVLVLACDYRLGAEGDHRIGLNEVAIGASFPRVALEIVRLRLPHARVSELLLGAALYPAGQALRLGVVDELFPPDKLRETALRRAARLGALPREAYAHSKATLIAETLSRVRVESEDEAERGAAIWTTPESRAARARQREKLGIKPRS